VVIIRPHIALEQVVLCTSLSHVQEMLPLLLVCAFLKLMSLQLPLLFFCAQLAQRVPIRLACIAIKSRFRGLSLDFLFEKTV
jgi:hypothetical protein